MNIKITGTALDFSTNDWSTFSMSFAVNGGTYVPAGCDATWIGAQVTDFSATLGGHALDAPADFSANIARTPYPCGGPVYGELVSGPVTLQSHGELFSPGSSLTGYFGTMQIESAAWSAVNPPATSAPEPDSLALLIPAVLLLCAHALCRWLSLLRRARSSVALGAPTRPAMAYAVLGRSGPRS